MSKSIKGIQIQFKFKVLLVTGLPVGPCYKRARVPSGLRTGGVGQLSSYVIVF